MIPAAGQVWREVGKDRWIKVSWLTATEVHFCSVKKNMLGDWQRVPGSRDAKCKADRFSGKPGGFEFVEEA